MPSRACCHELMNEMFENCTSIKTLDLSSFNTENIVNMSRMFYSCTSLNSLDLSSFNVSNCLFHENMFYNISPELMQKLNKSYPWVESFIKDEKDNSKENPSKDTTLPTQPSKEVKITTIIQEPTEAKEEKTTQNEVK